MDATNKMRSWQKLRRQIRAMGHPLQARDTQAQEGRKRRFKRAPVSREVVW